MKIGMFIEILLEISNLWLNIMNIYMRLSINKTHYKTNWMSTNLSQLLLPEIPDSFFPWCIITVSTQCNWMKRQVGWLFWNVMTKLLPKSLTQYENVLFARRPGWAFGVWPQLLGTNSTRRLLRRPPSGFSRRPAQPVFMGRLAGGCRRLWQLARHSDYPLLTASPPSSVRLSWEGAGGAGGGQEPGRRDLSNPIRPSARSEFNYSCHGTYGYLAPSSRASRRALKIN